MLGQGWLWWKALIEPLNVDDGEDMSARELASAYLHSFLIVLPFSMACAAGGELFVAALRWVGAL